MTWNLIHAWNIKDIEGHSYMVFGATPELADLEFRDWIKSQAENDLFDDEEDKELLERTLAGSIEEAVSILESDWSWSYFATREVLNIRIA